MEALKKMPLDADVWIDADGHWRMAKRVECGELRDANQKVEKICRISGRKQ